MAAGIDWASSTTIRWSMGPGIAHSCWRSVPLRFRDPRNRFSTGPRLPVSRHENSASRKQFCTRGLNWRCRRSPTEGAARAMSAIHRSYGFALPGRWPAAVNQVPDGRIRWARRDCDRQGYRRITVLLPREELAEAEESHSAYKLL